MINSMKKSVIGLICFIIVTTSVLADETIVDGMRDASLNDVRGLLGRQFADGRVTMSRSGSAFHQTGTRVFRSSVVGRFRGVVSQADSITRGDEMFGIGSILPLSEQEYPGHITLRTEAGELRYTIDYSELLPLVLVADAGATSLYSLTSDINDAALNDGEGLTRWAREAGMVIFEDEESVAAVELAGTPIHYALMFADLCGTCETEEISGFADAINRQNGVALANDSSDQSWIISDVGVRFEAVVSGSNLSIDGAMTRNRWTIGDGQDTASVTSVSAISSEVLQDFYARAAQITDVCLDTNAPTDCEPLYEEVLPEIYDLAFRDASLLRLDPKILIMENDNIDFISIGQKGSDVISRAEFAFETLALLRHTKAANPSDWNTFVASMSTDRVMAEYLPDWRRYAGALQRAAR